LVRASHSFTFPIALGMSALVQAQTADAPAAADTPTLDEVVVSSTRINRSGFTAPTPTTIVDAADFEARATTRVTDALFDLPSIRPDRGGLSTAQNTGLQTIDLRSLNSGTNAGRTLILVDGRRFVPTTIGGVVNTNVIPNALVERVDVVTGGASAAWGSDAIAGVVNFVLKDKLEGFRSDVKYGISAHGDDRERSVSLAWGSGFHDDRGQFMIAGEWSDSDQRQTLGARDWSNKHTGFVTGTLNGQAVTNIIADGLTLSNITSGGLIIGVGPMSPLRGIQFGPGGVVQPFVYGSNITGSFMQGGGGEWYIDRYAWMAPVERKNAYLRTTYELTDNVKAFAELSQMRSESTFEPFPDYAPNPRANIVIQRDNAFLPQQIKNILTANPSIQSFQIGRLNTEFGSPRYYVNNKTTRGVLGLEGKVGAGWQWKAYYTYGKTDYDAATFNQTNVINWTASMDAVLVNGVAVCRPSTVAALGAAPGCVPANPFGPGSLTHAVKNYVNGDPYNYVDYKQDTAGIQIQGEPFGTWAGPVSVVGGYEYRKESLAGDSDPLSKVVWKLNGADVLGAWKFGNPQPVFGAYKVNEVFAETVVPLLAQKRFSESLDLNAAVRLTDYSNSGRVTTSKVGLTYKPVSGLMFRGAMARDIRAPNLNELYASATAINFNPLDYGLLVNGQPSSYFSLQLTRGNPDLVPEESHDRTFGVTWQPELLPGFSAAVDYYSIEIDGAIASFSAQQIINGCYGVQGFKPTQSFCDLISRDPVTGRINSVTGTSQNFQSITQKGMDYELTYRVPESVVPGALTLRSLATHVRDFSVDSGAGVVSYAGEIGNNSPQGSTPKWRFNLSAMYQIGQWTAFAEAQYLDKGKYNNVWTSANISDNDIPSITYLDLSLQYSLRDLGTTKIQVYGKVNNVFDKDPPVAVSTVQNLPPANTRLYDTFGRTFATGVRMSF
jgi:iron complex outermembrane recepter protein